MQWPAIRSAQSNASQWRECLLDFWIKSYKSGFYKSSLNKVGPFMLRLAIFFHMKLLNYSIDYNISAVRLQCHWHVILLQFDDFEAIKTIDNFASAKWKKWILFFQFQSDFDMKKHWWIVFLIECHIFWKKWSFSSNELIHEWINEWMNEWANQNNVYTKHNRKLIKSVNIKKRGEVVEFEQC